MKKNIQDVKKGIRKLEHIIKEFRFPLNNKNWGGAGVGISSKMPKRNKNDQWYTKDCKYIVTPYSRELSWLFEELRDLFYKNKLIDFSTKHEFFGKLADSAQWYIVNSKKQKIDELLLVVLCESASILHDIRNNDPSFIPTDFDQMIRYAVKSINDDES